MFMSDVEERNAKCYVCAQDLSLIENLLYGNRCIFHAPQIIKIGLLDLLLHVYYDYRLYRILARLPRTKATQEYFLGVLAVNGYTSYAAVSTIKGKYQIVHDVKKMARLIKEGRFP